jgi:8-oxo-dGTP diphosphatase
MPNTSPIQVAAGILTNQDRILACQRHHSDSYGGLWEFPGGKVEMGESLEEALRRELEEELDIEAEIGPEIFRHTHLYPQGEIEVVFFTVLNFAGIPRNKVFEAIEWVPQDRLMDYPFLEADRGVLQLLCNRQELH